MKLLLLLFCLVLLAMPVFAVTTTNTSCLSPQSLNQVMDCLIKTTLFGYEVATVLFTVLFLFILAKAKAPLSVALPFFFCWIAFLIVGNIFTQVFQPIFFYCLIGLGLLLGLGLVRQLRG